MCYKVVETAALAKIGTKSSLLSDIFLIWFVEKSKHFKYLDNICLSQVLDYGSFDEVCTGLKV